MSQPLLIDETSSRIVGRVPLEPLGPLCPCGSGTNYLACCGPLHHGECQARTRPVDASVDPGVIWTGLEVTDVVAGNTDDDRGEVEFTARFESAGRCGELHERSRFERRAGRWFYVDAAAQ
jgi:SEC-C motif-containing protein